MFLDPKIFPFTAQLEDNWSKIRDEFLALPDNAFDPWVQGLFALGEEIAPACEKCPETAKLLKQIKGVSLAGFSRLAPGTHIEAHVGWAKSVYRLHLGLVVPPDCSLRVGEDTRDWEEGKCLIFDDTVEHEAWNHSDRTRGTLLLDFLRPGVKDFNSDIVPEQVLQYIKQLQSVTL